MAFQELPGLSVSEVAARLGRSPTTVRRYADHFSGLLSAGASARPRTFSEADVVRLGEAIRLRSHLEDEAIAAYLQDLHIGEILPTTDTVAVGTPIEAQEALLAPPLVVDPLRQRTEAAEQASRYKAWSVVVGVTMGIGIMVVVIVVFLLLAIVAR